MMRATIDAGTLAAALRNCVAQTKGTLPVLRHVLLETRGDRLLIDSTDLETRVATDISATVTDSGACCADAALLKAAASGGGSIELREEAGALIVKRGPRSRVSVAALPATHWPANESIEWTAAPIGANTLAYAIDTLTYAASRTDHRPFCSSLCLGRGYAASMSGLMLAMLPIDYTGNDLLIPLRSLAALRRILVPEASVWLGILQKSPHAIAVSHGADRVEAKLMQGAMPNVAAIIPADNGNGSVVVDRAMLKLAVSRITPFCGRVLPTGKVSDLLFSTLLANTANTVTLGRDDNVEEIPSGACSEFRGEFRAGINLSQLSSALDSTDSKRLRICQHGDGRTNTWRFDPVDHGMGEIHIHSGVTL